MKQFFTLAFLVISLFSYAQTKHFVGVGNNFFNPKVLNINQGDTVVWQNQQGFHNVNGSTGIYPSNPVSFTNGSASSAAWTYEFIFTTPGKYDYQCDPHAGVGMTGVVNVAPITGISTVNVQDINVQTVYSPNETISFAKQAYDKLIIYAVSGVKVAEFKAGEIVFAPSLTGVYLVNVLHATKPKSYKIVQ